MYESPIYTYIAGTQLKMAEDYENGVMEAIQYVQINVDKEELERALKYDREQYEKGYADGLEAGRQKAESILLELKGILMDYGYLTSEVDVIRSNY